MDSKVRRLAIAVFICLVALIGVIVYAANADQIHKLFTGFAGDADTSASLAEFSDVYGERIGDNLNGFVTKSDFFDESDGLASIYSADVTAVYIDAKAGDGCIMVSIKNNRGGLEQGQKFVVSIEGEDTDIKSLHTDEDKDGQILIKDLDIGRYKLKLMAKDGYHVPVSFEHIEVTTSSNSEKDSSKVAEDFEKNEEEDDENNDENSVKSSSQKDKADKDVSSESISDIDSEDDAKNTSNVSSTAYTSGRLSNISDSSVDYSKYKKGTINDTAN